jgi:hypothetical protein
VPVSRDKKKCAGVLSLGEKSIEISHLGTIFHLTTWLASNGLSCRVGTEIGSLCASLHQHPTVLNSKYW